MLEDPVPKGVRRVLTLFDEELSAVAFPDVSRASLQRAEEALQRATAEQRELETHLAAATEAVAAAQAALEQHAARALAYARVYAEGDPALAEKVAALALRPSDRGPRSEASPQPGTRSRRRRPEAETDQGTLLAAAGAAPEDAAGTPRLRVVEVKSART